MQKTKGIELIKVLPFFSAPWEDQTHECSQLLFTAAIKVSLASQM